MLFTAMVFGLLLAPAPDPIPTRAPERAPPAGRAVEAVRPEHVEVLAVLPEAERDLDKAKRLFAAGKQAGRTGLWGDAIPFFAEAYRYSASAGALYALGRGHRHLYLNNGRDPVQLRLALLRFDQFLQQSPGDANEHAAQGYVTELQPYARVLAGFSDATPITRLMIHSPVVDARISVDGAPEVAGPVTVDVDPGSHQVRVRAEGYHEGVRTLPVPEGTTVPLEVDLRPKKATLIVSGPRRAQLFIDGQVHGSLPLGAPIPLVAGPHQVAVSLRGRTPFIREATLARGETGNIAVDLPMTAQRKLAITSMALGGAGAVVAAALTGASLAAQRQASDIERERLAMGVDLATYETELAAWQRRDGLRTGATVAGAVGVTLVVTGVIVYFTDRSRLADRLYHPKNGAAATQTTAATIRVAPPTTLMR